MYKDWFCYFEQCLFVLGWSRYFEANPYIQMLVSIFCRQLICNKNWFSIFQSQVFIHMLVSIFCKWLIIGFDISRTIDFSIKTGFTILIHACLICFRMVSIFRGQPIDTNAGFSILKTACNCM
jgi:hypothetical protein